MFFKGIFKDDIEYVLAHFILNYLTTKIFQFQVNYLILHFMNFFSCKIDQIQANFSSDL